MGYSESEADRIARLTEKQRQCMELVVLRKSSKEIARMLGISKPTVDQRIANARNILRARNRDEAALIFSRHAETYDRVIYDPAHVPSPQSFVDRSTHGVPHDSGLMLQEAAIPFSGITEHHPVGMQSALWRPFDDLSTTQRVMIIVGLTVGILVIVLVGLAVAQSITDLLTAP